MKNFGKKFLASLLAVAQIITFTPVNNLTAFAADEGETLTLSDLNHPNWQDKKDTVTKIVITGDAGMVGDEDLNTYQNLFVGFTKLKEIDMSQSNMPFIPVGMCDGCTSLQTVKVSADTTVIGDRAFKDCASLTEINFPDKCKTIWTDAFLNDSALTSINLNKVETIKDNAFKNTGLTEINFPDSVKFVGPAAFGLCDSLQKISGGQGIQDNLSNNKNDKGVLSVAEIFTANETYTAYPLSPYPKDAKFTYTNVDNAVDCIKNGNWRLARRYQFEVKWIDATRKVWKDEDHVFDGYTAYFDYYNYKMQGKNSETTNAPTDEVIKPNKDYTRVDGRGTDYAIQTVDDKTLIPSDEWKLSKDENGKEVDITTDTTMDDIKENMDGHTINLYLTDYTTKYKVTYKYKYGAMSQDATESQLYNPDETLKDIPNPKDAGKTFMYWLDDKGNKVEINETTPVTRNITYTAMYNNASVGFYFYYIPNDGRKETIGFSKRVKPSVQKMGIAGTKLTDIPSTEDVTDEYGNVYKFKGWYNTEEYDKLTDENKVTVDETVIIKEGTNNFYGIYEQANTVTYQYKTTTGMVLQDERKAKVLGTLGDSYEDAPATIEKNGTTYTFSKWIDSADNSEVTLSKDTVVTGYKTYIAQYVAPQKQSLELYTAYADENNAIERVSSASYMSVAVGSKIDFPEKDSTVNLKGDIYIFKGWVKGRLGYTSTIENVSYLNTTNYICTADDTAFTAVYAPKGKCTVRFIAKDSKGNDKVLDDFTEKVDDGTSINLPPRYSLFAYDEYTKDGKSYELVDGWYKNNTDKYNYNAEVTITEDTDFYAHYKEVEPTKYTITILNDDDSTIKTFEVEENNSFNYSTKPISATDSSKEFYGWTYDDGIIEGVDISISNVTKNLTFRAVYLVKPKTYTVTFKPENGDADTVKTNVEADTLMSTIKPADPTRNHDTFLGWYKNDTKITDEYITADTTYIAKYTVSHLVKFVGFDEESSDMNAYVEDGYTYRDTTEATYDEYITEDFIPTKTGKTFKGWKVNDTNEIVSTKDAIDRVITEDTTFTATFEDNIVNLTFRFYDADNTLIKTSTVMQLSTTFADIPKPDSNPTKDGYTFKGWRAESDIVKDTDVFSEDTDFYPVFEENAPTEYTLRFFLQNADGNYVWKTDKVKAGDSYTLPTRDEINPLRFETTDGKTYEFLRWTKKGSAAYLDAVITPTSDMDFYADYREIHFYTVTLLNDDDSVITTEKVESSNYFTYDSTPTSKVNAEDKYFGYWKRTEGTSGSNTIFNSINIQVYDNVTYQAVYYDVHYVTIKFVDAEGNELNSVTMKEGNKITASDIPTKKANGNDILGWRFGITNDDILNTTFYTDRTYEAVPNITFKKKDGSTIKTVAATFNREKDYYDATQVEVPSDISRWTLDGTEYTSSEITDGENIKNIKKDLVFEEAVVVQPTIKIKFVDADETTVLKTEKVYALGILFNQLDAPTVNNKEDENYTYTFKGWRVKGETNLVNENRGFNTDTILVAVYDKVAKPVTPVEPEKVTARFVDYDDTELDSKEVTKGTTLGDITFTPSRNEDDEFTYTFKAWTVDNNEVTDDYVINEDTTFKATYTATPKQTTPVEPDPDVTITFKPENGEADTVKTDVISGSALGTVKIADPVKAEDDKFTYTFAGWKVEENDAVVDDSYVINKDTVFIATYTATRKTYHVIFKDEDGTIIEEKDVPTNTPLGDIKPNDPSKEGKDFKGWDDGTGVKPDDTPITKDTTFTATYEPKELPPTPEEPEKITVIFKDYDGTTIEEKQVDKNSFLGTVKPENPTRTDYKFVGWSKDDVVRDDGFIITEDTVFIATYVTKEIKLIQIDGTLLDKDGKPIANAVVTLHSTVRQTTTDENGYYIFKNVELEEHEVNAKVENTEVYKYNIDATDVENIKKVLESQDANYDVNSNISEKNGVVTITLNAKEKGNDTPTPEPTPTPTPEPVIPTPTPTPTPEKPKETVTIKFYLDYDLTELFDTVVVNKGEAFTYNKEPEGYKFWINVDQYVENRVYHNGETIYPMKDMTFYMEKEIKDTPDDSKVIDKPTDKPKKDDTPVKDNPKDNPKDTPKDNKKVPTPKDNPKEDNPKEDNKKKEDRDIPKTGDRVLIYVLGLIAGLAILKKKKKND